MLLLGQYVLQNGSLKELDVSWNRCKPHAYVPLLQALSQTKGLTHLNLSFNNLIEVHKY